ncbi:DEAD/DEAH box helicase [Bacillus sp. FJAT-50079]|uniref:DEAD/DEAH box helicase n=1 Tax=Bacillus sp. FJAT-50079 TaxID=2833577 RepID=UPI001BC9A630|nr:DEAD/DEAH box helicase [Bacillus sp. FJAT-50079]MBS4208275.1 DEAD/DEAH box helicase [Bacillus sp. FJAT-50079]
MSFLFSPQLQQFLSGRSLLLQEIPFQEKLIHDHLKHQFIEAKRGITQQKNGYVCNRCDNQTSHLFATFPCAHCKKDCLYCRKCIMMGRVSTCTFLYHWIGPVKPFSLPAPTYLDWSGQLSFGQDHASKAVIDAIETAKELTIWAVCGSGKTEVLFAGIERALQLGKRIVITTPRTDVVLELAPRLKKVFPTITIATLYGGSDDRHIYAPLTIATTHQLLRFEKAFDVIIIDEVDAFPYTFDKSLQFAVKKCAKPIVATIYLTATPSEKWQTECRSGKRNHVKIPARFHRHPLPLPQFAWCGNWRKQLKKGKIPAPIIRWMNERRQMEKQALIFFPHIELMENALPLFRRSFHHEIESVHAEDPHRKEKVEKMRKRTIPFLLTTTILERGVTFPNIDVAVIGAEDDIFTEAALVQISGRVGRSNEFPAGTITFFHYGRTKAMIKALSHMAEMNDEAYKKGLLEK